MKLENQVTSPSGRKLRGGGYYAIHKWLSKNYGKAFFCENNLCDKKSKRYHWALIKGKEYKHIRTNFIQLCASCHKAMDYTDAERQKHRKRLLGKRLSQSSKDKISKANKGRIFSKEHRKNLSKAKLGTKYATRKTSL